MKNSIGKNFNFLWVALIVSYMFTIFFWNFMDITNSLTPYLDTHNTNVQKYNIKYQELSIELFLNYSSSIPDYFKSKLDIGYDLINILSKTLGLNFEQFLFTCILLTYVAYLKTFLNITHCNYWLIYFSLLIFASFWMSFTLGGAVRQGLAITFLFYFLFRNNDISYFNSFVIIILASTIHLSAIIFIPYLIFQKIFLYRFKLILIIYFFVIIIYIFNINFFIAEFLTYISNYFNFDLRALRGYGTNHPTSGFSIYKLLASIIPIFLFLLVLYKDKSPIKAQERRVCLFYIYPIIIGMLLSQMSYYDRILLYSWAFSPFLMAFFCYQVYPVLLRYINKNQKIIKIKL